MESTQVINTFSTGDSRKSNDNKKKGLETIAEGFEDKEEVVSIVDRINNDKMKKS